MDIFKTVARHSPRNLRFPAGIAYGCAILLAVFFVLYTYPEVTKRPSGKNKQSVAPLAYIISLTTPAATLSNQRWVQVRIKLNNHLQNMMGMNNDSVSMDLSIVPAGVKDLDELTAQLKTIPQVRDISVVALSKPARSAELTAVRKLFAGFGLDASKVSNKQLSLFLESTLEGQYAYYIDLDRKQNPTGLKDMHIKPLEEHPEYSPEWRRNIIANQQGTTQNPDTLLVDTVLVQITKEVKPPPPPLPPPAHLNKMSNAEIRRWIRKNDSQNVKDKDIQVNRTAGEVVIAITRKHGTETVHYKINE